MALAEMQAQPQAVGELPTNVDQIVGGLNSAPDDKAAHRHASEEIQFIVSQSKKAGNGLFKEKKYKGESCSPVNAA